MSIDPCALFRPNDSRPDRRRRILNSGIGLHRVAFGNGFLDVCCTVRETTLHLARVKRRAVLLIPVDYVLNRRFPPLEFNPFYHAAISRECLGLGPAVRVLGGLECSNRRYFRFLLALATDVRCNT